MHRVSRSPAFTLLEVMIATVIVAMLTFALHRFIATTLRALSMTTALSEERQEVDALTRVVQAQLNDLPANGQGVLMGKANRFNNLSSDEMTWLCRAGQGLMTGAAAGEYRVTLTVQPVQESKDLELGLRREVATQDLKTDLDFFTRGNGATKYNWLPLIRPVAALEIRYWDQRTRSWINQWNDLNSRPSVVQMKIWKNAETPPNEVILPIASVHVQQP